MDTAFNILIADDDSSVYSASIKPFVNDLPHAKVFAVDSPARCRAITREHAFHFILLDISFGPNDASGLALLQELRSGQPGAKIFMLSNHDDHGMMIKCMQGGATDFISKRDINMAQIARVIRGYIDSETQNNRDVGVGLRLASLVGARFESKGMKDAFAKAALAQRNSSTPVLIVGETGVGKDVIARAITATGTPRPVVSVDCGAISETLADSELFGHERGSFTGAERATAGKFRAANGGDLFLDEIGNLKRGIQEKLLRALQNKEITPVGGKSMRVNVRVIAATNENLDSQVAAGSFRKDLLERLKGIVIHVPPLRSRPEDIPHIVQGIIAASARPDLEIAPTCMSLLAAYSWPGNVRELENLVKTIIASAATGPITVRHLPEHFISLIAAEKQIRPLASQKAANGGPTLTIEIPVEAKLADASDIFLKSFIENRRINMGVKPSSYKLAEALDISRNTLRTYVSRLGLFKPRARKK